MVILLVETQRLSGNDPWFKGLVTIGRELRHNTRVISCPAPGRPCCCRNYRPTVINPDYKMTKQRCIKCIYDKIRSESPPNQVTSLHASIVTSRVPP